MEKANLSKGYQNPKRKLRVTMHFSEIIIFIELKFGKKMPYILCILKLLLNQAFVFLGPPSWIECVGYLSNSLVSHIEFFIESRIVI